MYIVQIADLHIGSESKCLKEERIILSEGIEQIKQYVPKNQNILICVCGDVIDSKNLAKEDGKTAKTRYDTAAELFRLMEKKLGKDYDIRIRFCLGNHDVTHINDFFNFSKNFYPQITMKKIRDGYYMDWNGINYIFLNSCNKDQYKYGCIDYASLEQILKDVSPNKPKIIVLHHTVISMYENDESAIRDSARLLNLIEKYKVSGILHGHIHGKESFFIGHGKCIMIGAGALFSRNNANVNSQFNIIEVGPNGFVETSTFVYMADDRISGEPWYKKSSEKHFDENYFEGGNFQVVYEKLLRQLAYKPVLNNVVMQINCSYDKFKKSLADFFQADELVIGKKRFTYFQLAELWEEITVPPCLYFNHGMYFKVRGEEHDCAEVHGIQVVARQLQLKPTSNKAVLTTYSMDTVPKMLKGEEYLPSLLSVQFSQSKDRHTIYVHMYLRALEAERFLKINICEVKWLLERLTQEGITFDAVDIAISAFRVQKREKFNCFLKAEIDNMSEIQLTSIVNAGNIKDICQMLEEKKDASETITNIKGLEILCEAMKESNKIPHLYNYSPKAIEKLDNVLNVYKELDAIHKKESINTEEEKSCEAKINEGINEVIIEIKKEGA